MRGRGSKPQRAKARQMIQGTRGNVETLQIQAEKASRCLEELP